MKIKAFYDGDDYVVIFKDPPAEAVDEFNRTYDPELISNAYVTPVKKQELRFVHGKYKDKTPSEALAADGNEAFKYLRGYLKKFRNEMSDDINKALAGYIADKYADPANSGDIDEWDEKRCLQFFASCDSVITPEMKKVFATGFKDYQTFVKDSLLEQKRNAISAVIEKITREKKKEVS